MRFRLLLLTACLLAGEGLPAAKPEAPPARPWSFAPLRRAEPPPVRNTAWPRTRIDRFLLARMEAEGLQPAPEADARTLARRLAFALTGLPPDPALTALPHEVRIDRLLQNPHYGERWARHWLDLARYTDQLPTWLTSTRNAHLYRDWVVQAFNEDLPYDRFVLRQLATDSLPGSGPQDLPALGFLGLSPTYFKELQLPPDIIKTTVADEWEEHVDAVTRTFLGLTVACARCHDHKSDPVTAADYYALAGVFASVKQSERPMMDETFWVPVKKAREVVAELEKQVAALKKAKAPAARSTELEEKIALVKKATPHYDMPMANAVEEAALFVVEADNKKGTKLDYRMGMARDLALQKRGNPNDEGEIVPRRFLSAFPLADGQPRAFTQGSGRYELAQAIVGEAAPLTARVIVNRIWKHHFGRGLVETPSEFGNLGEAPSHPELLDDLAARFIDNGWSLKWLHREILASAAWRQSSRAPAAEASDPANQFYARMPRRRLDWESWRDALLAGAGALDRRLGGPALAISDPANTRRSLYGASNRQDMDPMMRLHDVPDPGAHSPWRTETLTPLQGLFALNSPFFQQQADRLAAWLQAQPGALPERVEAVYERLFQRPPLSVETTAAARFLSGREAEPEAWSEYAHALLASNEMLFVD